MPSTKLRFKDDRLEWDEPCVLRGDGGGGFQLVTRIPVGGGANAQVFTARDEEGGLRAVKISTMGGIRDDSVAEVENERRLAAKHGERFRTLTLPILDAGKVECEFGEEVLRLRWLARPLGLGSLEKWMRGKPKLAARLT